MLPLASKGQFNINDDIYLLYDINSCASTHDSALRRAQAAAEHGAGGFDRA